MTEDRDYSDDGRIVGNASELLERNRQKRQLLLEEQHVLENEIAEAEAECQARHFFEEEHGLNDKKKWVLPSGIVFDDIYFERLRAKGWRASGADASRPS